MTVRELINELLLFNPDQEVEICCYTSIGRTPEMEIYYDIVDKYGLTPCQVHKEITFVNLLSDQKTVGIS